MASLCISPLHAGIMSLSTPNSSFILLRRRRSIRLCAVFLAIFRPAALVADGGLRLLAAAAFAGCSSADAALAGAPEGFIWIILRVRVGGGGRSNGSVPFAAASAAVEERFRPVVARDFVTGAGCGLDIGECGWYEEEDDAADVLDGRESKVMAGGGSSKDICEEMKEPSRLLRSVEEEGVGGAVGRGIFVDMRARARLPGA